MDNFDLALGFVLQWEGAYSNHPNDRGGPTNYGITQRTFNEAKKQGIINDAVMNIQKLTLDDAKRIYKKMYWDKINGDVLPVDLSIALFDTAVNMGVATSVIMLQDILNVTQDGIIGSQTLFAIENYNGNLAYDFLNERETRYKTIVEDNPSQGSFLKGWLNRVADLRDYLNDYDLTSLWAKNIFQRLYNGIVSSTQQLYGVTKKVQSPIALDLDGDGIETNNVNDGAYFDHDANGFTEKTGWVGSDDGILVYDRNNDGIIDTGTETFGNNTPLLNGTPAANGFEALAELDGNHDGKIDVQDSIWPNLKIWQDFDGDGYSAADEMWSLSDVGVSSIDTSYANSNYIDPNGNEHRQVGSFNRADGTTGNAADVWFVVNRAFSIANEWLDVPEDIAALPDLQGYGNIYNLHQATVRDTTGGLKALVASFVTEVDPNVRSSLMEQILLKWTGSEGVDPNSRGPNINAQKLAVLEKLFADEYVWYGGPDPGLTAGTLLNHCYKGLFEMYYADLVTQTHLKDLYDKITYTWDEATQSLKGDLSIVVSTLQDQLIADPAAGKVMLGEFARSLRGFQAQNMVNYWGFRQTFAAQSEELSWAFDSGGHNIVIGTTGSDSLSGVGFSDAIYGGDGNDNLSGDSYNFYISTSGVLYGGPGNDTLTGYNGSDLLVGGAGNDTLIGEYHAFSPGGDILDGGPGNDFLQGGQGNDLYLFDHGYGEDTIFDYDTTPGNLDTLKFAPDISRSDVEITRNGNTLVFRIKGTVDQVLVPDWITRIPNRLERVEFGDGTVLTGDEVTLISEEIRGTSGNDILNGSAIRDRIYGEAGDDTVYGFAGDDLLVGGPGNDTLIGDYQGTVSADTLDGGPGNDSLQGGSGNDTYLFGRGYDTDTIFDYDTTLGNLDTLKFAPDISRADVEITRNGNTLVFRIKGTADQVLVPDWITRIPNRLERVEFGDGTVLAGDEVTMISEEIRGTSGNDILNGSSIRDRIYGEAGDDTIYGFAGDDLLVGGPGNDTLIGDYQGTVSTDTLDGGPGNDSLQGGSGNDTYLFGRGYDTDAISDYDTTSGNIDKIQFNPDILPSDVKVMREGNNLVLGINWTSDRITVLNHFYNDSYKVEQVEFGDGSSFKLFDIQIGGTGNDNLTGGPNDSLMMGDAGNDILNGGGGNDLINGGTGADSMIGGPGNDTYIVDNVNDTITEEINAGTDKVWSSVSYVLGPNIENLTLSGNSPINGTGNELDNVLTGNSAANILTGGEGNDTYVIGPGDTVIENQNGGSDTVFSPESIVLPDNVENLILTGTGSISGTGNSLDNFLVGNSGANTLDGDGGADQMRGGPGDDTYVVESERDSVIEDPNQGTDTVLSSIDWILGPNIENLTLMGTQTINGTGNDLNNILIGNTASNLLIGASGDDILDGGLGNDFLEGGFGNDLYLFGRGYGQDIISDDGGNGDTLRFALGVEQDDVEITREGDSVIFRIKGTLDQVWDPEWITKPSNRLEKIEFGDGTLLSGDDVTDLFKEIRGTSGEDDLKGTSGTDRIYGLEGDDILNGFAGDDLLVGGPGDDTYIVDSMGDVVSEALNEGTDTVLSSIDYTLGENLENLTLLSGAVRGTGNELNNFLVGNSASNLLEGAGGDDTLDGGGGADTLIGGLGNDTYLIDDSGDMVTEEPNQGVDTILSSITYTLGPNLENLILTGTDRINGTGNELDNVLIGNSNANILDGGLGADEMIGDAGDDIYIVGFGDTVIENPDEGIDTVQSSIDYILGQNIENLILTGSANKGTGNELNNTLIGNSEANILDGRAGSDWMYGGAGDDLYIVDNVNDKVIELSCEGIDSVESSVTYVLDKNIENLILTGTDAINGTGNELDNILTGNMGANILGGGQGNDTYMIGLGDMVIENEDEGIDTILTSVAFMLPANVENGTLTGTADANVTGNELNNVLIGNNGANLLNGGTGADTMMGGSGNDTYIVDNTGDSVIENTDEGIDTVMSSIVYTLGPNLENLTLTGTASINGTGNELENILIGNSADNVLDGGAGVDILIGGLGNDTYWVDNKGDIVIEFAGEGTDIIFSSIDYTLGENVEDLTLTGNAVLATGNDLNNVLTGNNALNELRGRKGDDTYIVGPGDSVFENQDEGIDTVQSPVDWTLEPNVENLILVGTNAINGRGNGLDNTIIGNSAPNILAGGLGDDTYVIGLGDTVVENANEGIDTILSPETLILPANVENGTLTGTIDADMAGNELDNVLIGNEGSNRIDGKTGADTMVGGLGDDIYTVDNRKDIVIEAPNEGVDTVQSSISYILGANLENLVLTGSSRLNGTGNELDNTLIGNSGFNILRGGGEDDILDGGGGINILMGGLGNDTYVIRAPWDRVVEGINEGVDTIESSISYMLGPNVENLILKGKAVLGNGNHLDNELIGNDSSNLLMGHEGNDRLLGGGGNDDLRGGPGDDVLDGGPGDDVLKGDGGNDTYLFGRGYDQDTIWEHGNDKQAGDMDRVRFNFGLNPIALIFVKDGKDLNILLNGSSDLLTIENQNKRSGPQVEIFETFDGRRLLASEINLLIQEMAGFSKQTGMNWNQLIEQKPTEVQQILAQYWQPNN